MQVSGLKLGRSKYNAMTARLKSRFTQGFSVLSNYTFGKLMDDAGGADGQGGKTVQSFDSYHAAWGLSPLDRKHRVNMAYTYELPFGRVGSGSASRTRRVEGNGLIAGGWQVAGNYST